MQFKWVRNSIDISSVLAGGKQQLPVCLFSKSSPVAVQLALAYGSATHICAFAMWMLLTTLLLSNSYFVWQMTHYNQKCYVFTVFCLKKRLQWANMMFSSVYMLNLSVCNAYEGETNHRILKHTYPHRSSGAAWYWEAELSYSLPGFLFTWGCHSCFKSTVVFCHEDGQILTRVPSEAVSSPPLETLRTWLAMTLSNML